MSPQIWERADLGLLVVITTSAEFFGVIRVIANLITNRGGTRSSGCPWFLSSMGGPTRQSPDLGGSTP
jgi:hypothetical protein